MASIKISDLSPAGSEFFVDSESFMTDLYDRELDGLHGGWFLAAAYTVGMAARASSNACAMRAGAVAGAAYGVVEWARG